MTLRGTRFKLLFGVLAAMALSACAEKRLPMSSIVEVEHNDGRIGGDAYRSLRLAGQDAPYQRGSQIVEVRTYASAVKDEAEPEPETEEAGEGGGAGHSEPVSQVEFAGADCVLKGDLFSASVVSPAGVRVPLYGYKTGELSLECTKDGFERGTAIVEPYNKTFAERRQGASGGGLLGALLIEIINAASDETNDEFEYLFTPVSMERIEKVAE